MQLEWNEANQITMKKINVYASSIFNEMIMYWTGM